MNAAPLLVELFTEELPPKALKKLGEAFAAGIHAGLVARGLVSADARRQVFATPRRLATCIADVSASGADRPESKKLMPAKVAFDGSGNATPALEKRLQKEGAISGQVVRRSEGGEELVFLEMVVRGMSLTDALQAALLDTIAKLPIPKLMTYQLANGLDSVQFVRPAHGLVAMHGQSVVPVAALGLTAGSVTHGHRFQGVQDIHLASADEFETRLEKEGGVIASFDKRRHEIERLLREHAEQCGDTLGEREQYVDLLHEVTGLVELPTVYVGKFEQEFLEVPAECLTLTMKLNQKYFPMFHSEGGLSSRFLIVSNMRLDNPRNVIEGNQRVVRPRLADARFFFETDKKTKLADRVARLLNVVYHNKLGSQADRVERVRAIAAAIAKLLKLDVATTQKIDTAAQLAKADLVTDMVGEFPELQGTMGKYYALSEGLDAQVADAIEDHYKPRFAGDSLPRNDVGVIVALADKLETLVGMFGIGQVPTGDKDPFALRRHALGVVRILVERKLALQFDALIANAALAFGNLIVDPAAAVVAFTYERFAGSLKEQGFSAQEIDAVLSLRPQRLSEVAQRLAAVRAFSLLPEAQALAAANKRIGNILKKSDNAPHEFIEARLTEDAEKSLGAAMARVVPSAKANFDAGNYEASLTALAALGEPVDTFFEKVMVNADDPVVRANRLGLLATLHREMNRVADLSKLAS